MDDLKFEQRLDMITSGNGATFIARFIEPAMIGIEDKLKFETLFELHTGTHVNTREPLY